jgi:hypothetical protein
LDIYFCPFFETPTTFEQNFLPFSAFGKIHQNEHFLIKNSKVLKTDKNVRKNLGHPKHPQRFSLFDQLKKGYLDYK